MTRRELVKGLSTAWLGGSAVLVHSSFAQVAGPPPDEPTDSWPSRLNTGVASGAALSPHQGNLTLTVPGTVVSGLNIQGTVYINAPDVTLKDTMITVAGYAVVKIANVKGVTVQNCTINGVGTGNDGSNGIQGTGTFIGNNIFNVENGITVDGSGPTLIQDNYIHDLLASGSPHYDGIQIDGGIADVEIRHNTIINTHIQTSAVMIDNYYGAISNIKVDNNVLAGGGYTIYVDGHFNKFPISDVSITNNHMAGGYFGIVDFNRTRPVYRGNVNDGVKLAKLLLAIGR
jgi:hypothetical protein